MENWGWINVNVWTDPWLPDGDTRRPRTLQGRSLVTKVKDLIDPVTGGWDAALVLDNFYPDEEKSILYIILCENMDDNLA